MPSPAIPVAAIAAKTETPIATIPPANFAKPFNMTASCRLPGGDVFLAEKQKNPPWEPFPRRALDAARPSAFYIDYGALTAFRLLKTSKKLVFRFRLRVPPRSSGAIGRVFGDLSRAEKR